MTDIERYLNDLESDNEEDRNNAAITLGELGDKRAAPVLREQLSGQDFYLRAQAVQLLGKVGDPSDIPAMIQVAISDGDYEARAPIARGLQELDAEQAGQHLIKHLDDPVPQTRRFAAEVLGHMKAYQALPHLIKILQEDSEIGPRTAAAEAIGAIGHTSVVPLLIERLTTDPATQMHVILALGKLGDRRAVPALLDLFERRLLTDWGAYSAFAEALGELADPAATEALVYLIRNITTLVPDHVNDLSEEFSPSRGVVYGYAAHALERIGGDRAIDVLCEQLKSEEVSFAGKREICEAFGEMGDKRVVEPLIDLLQETDNISLRRFVVQVLSQIADTRATRPLRALLAAEDSFFTHEIARALEAIGTPEAISAVATWRRELRDHKRQ